jgi:hypothetical protein
MSQLDQRVGSLFEPLYSQSDVNAPISIGTWPIRIDFGGSSCDAPASAKMQFTPKVDLIFEAKIDRRIAPTPSIANSQKMSLILPERSVSFEVFQSSAQVSSSSHETTARFMPKESVVTATPPNSNIRRTVFHLFNFPDFSSSYDYIAQTSADPNNGWVRCGFVSLKADGWIIKVAAMMDTDKRLERLKEEGGWFITHVGEIVREDGSAYDDERLKQLLCCLHYCLSFALGRWVGIALPVGFDLNGSKVFEQWGMPIAADGSWKGPTSWFDDRHGQSLIDLFPGFYELWNREPWKRPLEQAIYWYLGACDRGTGIGVDTGLVIAQTAFELLAWNHCVRDRRMVSEDAFKPRGLSAANRFRLLASSLEIPIDLPPTLTALHAKRGKKWVDGMDAITDIRNSLVHPHDERQLPKGSEFDAWRLSMWYLNLIILRLCKYNGHYGNRLNRRSAGELELVPWAGK